MLNIYASENFAKGVRMIESLFNDDIKKPKIKEPDEPKIQTGMSKITKTQKKIYDSKIMVFVKKE